jgi:hypothetical protein
LNFYQKRRIGRPYGAGGFFRPFGIGTAFLAKRLPRRVACFSG